MSALELKLRNPTNQTAAGPRFRMDEHEIVVEYDYERDDGTVEWSQIVFRDVLLFEYRQESCCEARDVVGATEIRALPDSELLSGILSAWRQSVGWQEWQMSKGGHERFRHFTIFFDNAGCVNVVAASCRTSQRADQH